MREKDTIPTVEADQDKEAKTVASVPTNHELHIMLTRLEGKMDNVMDKLDTVITDHGTKISGVEKKVSKLNTLAALVGVTSAGVGVAVGAMKDKIVSALFG